VLRGYSGEYLRRYHARHISYNAALDALLSGEYPPHSLIIAPSASETIIKNGENRPGPLKRAVGESMARVEQIFGALPGTVRHYRDAG
jgi:hypothetical protein